MTRRLTELTVSLSILLLVATVGFWANSYSFKNAADGAGFIGTIRFSHDANTATWEKIGVWSSSGLVAFGVDSVVYDERFGIEWVIEEEQEQPYSFGTDEVNFKFPRQWSSFDGTPAPIFPRDFFAGREAGIRQSYVAGLSLPYWSLVLLFLVLPAYGLFRRCRRTVLRRENLCVECGYDLRATPERCSECGAAQKCESL